MNKTFQNIQIKPIEGANAVNVLLAMSQPKKRTNKLIYAKIGIVLMIAILSIILMVAFNVGLMG